MQSNSLENSEDEYEEESNEMESQLNRTNKRTSEFQKEQINVFENLQPKIIKEIPISSNSNKQNESKEDTEINLDLKITVDPDFQNELNATMQDFKGENQILEENIDVELNIEVLDDLDSQPKSNDNVQIQHDIDTTQELDAKYQLSKKIDEEIEQNIEEIVDTMYDEESPEVNIQVLNNLSQESQVIVQKKVQSDIDELNSFFEQLDEDSFKDVETLVVKELHKIFPFTKQDKYIENTFISLHEKCAPFDERVEKLCNLYFPTMSLIHQDDTTNINSEFEKRMQKRRNEELVRELDEIHNTDVDTIEIDGNWIHLMNNTTDNIDTETQIELSNPMDIMKKALENFERSKSHNIVDETQQIIEKAHDNCDDILIKKVCQRFDVVIQLNKEIQQNVDGQPQMEVNENIQINLNEEIKKRFEHEAHKNRDKIQQKIDKNDTQFKFCNKTQTIEEKIQNEVVEEMEVDSDGDIEMEIIKSTQKHLDNKIQDKDKTSILIELEFYKHIQKDKNELSQKRFKNEIQKHLKTNMALFKCELMNKAKESDKFDIEIQDSDVDIENSDNEVQFDTEIQSASKLIIEEINKNTQEELGIDITNCDCEIEFESEIEIEVNDDKTEIENRKLNKDVPEDFDVNIEDYGDKTQFEFEIKPKEFDKEVKQTNKSSLENNKTKEQQDKNENINQQQLVEDLHEFEENPFFTESNEVVEIIEDVEIISDFMPDKFISTEKEFIFTEEVDVSTENESSVTEEEFLFIEEEVNRTKKECESEFSSTDDELYEILNEIKEEDELKTNKNMPISQKLQIKQEELQIKQNRKLNQQLKEFQTEFYSNLKQEYEKELPLNKQLNLETSPIFVDQQQTFYELKDEFKELKQEYKSFIHEKWLNDLQEMDNNKLYEDIHFAMKNDNKPDFKTYNMYNELVNFQQDFSKLKPEFKCNVPIDYKENIKSLQQKPFNLFEKLYSIHTEKLCSFVDAKQWPENVSKDNVTYKFNYNNLKCIYILVSLPIKSIRLFV